ncbi:MAG: hypothetical protein V1838_00180 [Patescibacteria group bacterium]
MTQREIKARCQLAARIKELHDQMNLPPDPSLNRTLYSASIRDLEGIYAGLIKMETVYQKAFA